MAAGTEDLLLKQVGIDQNYDIIRKIGEGGFGQVHLVESKDDQKQYVVKVIYGRTRDEIDWAKKEIQFLKEIEHRNIVLYKEDFEVSNGVIVIMEYCSGGDLAKVIKTRSNAKLYFREHEVIEWLTQICEALEYLHSKHILHRDLKPANIFIADGNIIKLGDFGVSRQLISSFDQATTMVGTPLYISPEMQQQQPYSYKSDVWSAGCAVYEMMAFHPAIDPMMVYMTQQWVVRPMPMNYSKDLRDVIQSMLTVDPTNRPSMKEILEFTILQQCIANRTVVVVVTPDPSKPTEPEEQLEPEPTEPVSPDDLFQTFVHVTMKPTHNDTTIRPGSGSEVLLDAEVLSTSVFHTHLKNSAEERLAEFGYKFNDNGQLRSVTADEPFRYEFFQDRAMNENRYQEIAKVVNEYVGDLLEIELQMSRVTLPVDYRKGEPFTFIYATPDFLMNRDKMIVLVGGGSAIRAGVWSRKVVINDSLETGSQMSVVRRAVSEGYAVVILNQNLTEVLVDGVTCRVRDNHDARNHASYFFDAIIIKNTRVKHIAFLAHSEGGRVVAQLAIDREEYFRKLVFAVAFCNSRHDDVLRDAPKPIIDFFNTNSRNWIASAKPLNESLSRGGGLFSSRKDSGKVSAGDLRPEWTVSSAKDAAFSFIDEKYRQAIS